MYYSAGTYEAFARPEKPEGADRKSAYIIGTGLAGLSAAFYLVRDGQVKGERIHLLEKLDLAGGSCDGRKDVRKGFYMRGGREMDNHFECMWDMFRDVPSIETPGVSVLDEYYWLNKHDPNYSLCRASEKCGQDAHTDKKFTLDKDSALALSKLFMTPEKDLEDKKISEILPDSFWDTNFWLYWQTMFAFQRWSSALEMKRYLCRYCHHIDGLPDFSALRFTKYNQYESMILPLVKYLESHGVSVEYGMDVKNVVIKDDNGKKSATQIVYEKDGKPGTIDLIEDDLVFITNGCCTDTSCYGDQNTAPDLSRIKNGAGESWDLWKNIAAQAKNGEYGNPDKFCDDFESRNYVKKAMRDCTGEEVCREWLYHIGVPTDQIDGWAKNRCNTTTCFMPYINAFFQPRKESDRPLVVPEGAVNFAFLGQFAETPRDTIFTTEYSIRTGMEAVYTLMNVDRGVPEVWGSKYDVRELLRAAYYAVDKKPIDELPLSLKEKIVLKKVIKAVEGTDLEILLKESGLLR